jgi:hypothetical protein
MDAPRRANCLGSTWRPDRRIGRNGSASWIAAGRADEGPDGIGPDIPEPEHILQVVADGLQQEFPPLSSLGIPTNLPPFPTPIIGRDQELAEIAEQFRSAGVRLVTLIGPGGSGKTRLAIAAAELLGSSRVDGVYFVPLATANTSDVMWSPIAENLGIPGEGEHLRRSSSTSGIETCC